RCHRHPCHRCSPQSCQSWYCWRAGLDILKQNRDLLEKIAQQILETEVIEGEELQQLLSQAQPVDKATVVV
ncbi:MAG: hypothetical protein F6J92_28080, partial [Symploca sp. SIO1A3]|nr:hypothetical protein [Symploca sp. SIO1A3]